MCLDYTFGIAKDATRRRGGGRCGSKLNCAAALITNYRLVTW
jgi:hypothetical protein